jgi:DUF4097 and DUF4098 domain-containing protein YvlB
MDALTQTQRFTAAGPIAVAIDAQVANIELAVGNPGTVTAWISPKRPHNRTDQLVAQQTLVTMVNGQLTIRTPRRWQAYTPWGGYEAVAIKVEVPPGSSLHAKVGAGAIAVQGEMGAVVARTGAGRIDVAAATDLDARTGAGDMTATRVGGTVRARTANGDITVGVADGEAHLQTANGTVELGRVGGMARCFSGNGRVTVGRVEAGAHIRVANGRIIMGALAGGEVTASTGRGQIDLGVVPGVAVKLDLAGSGTVTSELGSTDGPSQGQPTATVHARTGFGDILVHRARD